MTAEQDSRLMAIRDRHARNYIQVLPATSIAPSGSRGYEKQDFKQRDDDFAWMLATLVNEVY